MVTVDIAALRSIEREKEISFETVMQALETALLSAYRHTNHPMPHARVEIDHKTGVVTVWAAEYSPDGELIEEFDDTPTDFGRIAAMTAKQVIMQRLRDAEHDHTYGEYSGHEGDIVTGIISGRRAGGPARPGAGHPRQGRGGAAAVRAGARRGLRRTAPGSSATWCRWPGACAACRSRSAEPIRAWSRSCSRWRCRRSPTAAWRSWRWPASPVTGPRSRCGPPWTGLNAKGACIGPMGQRVRNVVAELHGEKIDIIDYDDDPATFVGNALSPASAREVTVVDPVAKAARVVVPDYQLSLAIGREGQNARLAARLTGWRIDIHSDAEPAAPVADADGDPAPPGGHPATGTGRRGAGRRCVSGVGGQSRSRRGVD